MSLRHRLLKADFQRKLLQEINQIQTAETAEPQIDSDEVAADPVQLTDSQDSPTEIDLPFAFSSESACLDAEGTTATPCTSTKILETMAVSKELPVRVVEHLLTSTPTEDIEDTEATPKRRSSSTSLRLQGLISAIQRTRALVNSERRQNTVVVLQNEPGYTALHL